MKINDIISILNDKLMLSNQEKWDNSGLQIGEYDTELEGIVIALDLSEEVLNYSIEKKANLIITHHPFLFRSIKYIDYSSLQGRIIKKLVKNDITLISLHTSLDGAVNGITEELSNKLSVSKYEVLHQSYEDDSNNIFGFGGIGFTERITLRKYSYIVKKVLKCDAVKVYSHDLDKIISKIAFCGGNGADFIEDAIKKSADVYVTGDIKYHEAQYALNSGLSLIDAGHFHTENVILDKLYDILSPHAENLNKYTENTVIEYII